MTLAIAYPHDHRTREPHPMKAREIWEIAAEVRKHLVPRRPTPRLDLERIVRATRSLVVNSTTITTHWDLERTVHDGHGREALGVTEVDPALPGTVLISLNAAMIAERDYLKRSTLAHELGHAVFDGPSMLRQAGRIAFAMVTPDEWHLTEPARGAAGIDWREFRANEFMGALLAPRALLNRELVRRAIAFGLPVRDVGAQEPVLSSAGDPDRMEGLLLDLGERFGVSATFIEYRLHRYALVQ